MSIEARLNKLDDRERKLLGALGGVAAVLLLLVLPIALLGMLSSRQGENDDIRAVLSEIDDARSTISDRKAKAGAVVAKYSNPAPTLAGFIEQAAKAHSLTAADTQDKPETPHGKLYTERYTAVKMHKISLLPFVQMLEQIESSGHPVAVTRLNIRPRPNEPDQYETEVGISAYDRKETKPAAGAAPSATASAGPDEEETQ